jgi:hypothetical protein
MRKAISFFAPGLIVAAAIASGCNLARAQNCPGNPDALGTSRVLALDPREYPRVGAMDHAHFAAEAGLSSALLVRPMAPSCFRNAN